jgi:hypothetical protein
VVKKTGIAFFVVPEGDWILMERIVVVLPKKNRKKIDAVSLCMHLCEEKKRKKKTRERFHTRKKQSPYPKKQGGQAKKKKNKTKQKKPRTEICSESIHSINAICFLWPNHVTGQKDNKQNTPNTRFPLLSTVFQGSDIVGAVLRGLHGQCRF